MTKSKGDEFDHELGKFFLSEVLCYVVCVNLSQECQTHIGDKHVKSVLDSTVCYRMNNNWATFITSASPNKPAGGPKTLSFSVEKLRNRTKNNEKEW